jgi:DNA repair exonuclease SbcCD nuclease subunit
MAIEMTEILAKKSELGSLDATMKRLKALQSAKCRLKKKKSDADYDAKMREILAEEQVVKEVRQLFTNKKKSVPEFTQDDVNVLNFEDTLKAIKSIQSKKCLSQNEPSEYERACNVEKMLLEHKKQVRPADETSVKKTELRTLLEELQSLKPTQGYRHAIKRLEELAN